MSGSQLYIGCNCPPYCWPLCRVLFHFSKASLSSCLNVLMYERCEYTKLGPLILLFAVHLPQEFLVGSTCIPDCISTIQNMSSVSVKPFSCNGAMHIL